MPVILVPTYLSDQRFLSMNNLQHQHVFVSKQKHVQCHADKLLTLYQPATSQ